MKRHDWINLAVGLTLMLLMFAALWLRGHSQAVTAVLDELRAVWAAQRAVLGTSAGFVAFVWVLTWDDDDSDL